MGFRRGAAGAPAAPAKVEDKPVKKASGGGGKKTYHNNALTVFQNKDGGVFVSINPKSEIEIKIDGKLVTGIITKDPLVELEESVEAGRLTQKKADEIAAKVQNILGNVTLVTE